ncbi:MAG TPA: hypothetical protein PKA96_00100 [Candidatus Paceibacterota bacterium]|nr:hypothetical protein [Candidatus Paceibacterota bacterium]
MLEFFSSRPCKQDKPRTCVRYQWLHAQIGINKNNIIHLAIGISLLVATATNQPAMIISQSQKNTDDSTPKSVEIQNINENKVIENTETELKKLKTTKEVVHEKFSDIPIMIEIARCESGFRHQNSNGEVLRGYINSADVGVMQINEKYHSETAKRLGYNIYSLDGNMEYARYLYETQGTRPWIHSSKCWNSIREVAFAN